jgi:hypothetical protein
MLYNRFIFIDNWYALNEAHCSHYVMNKVLKYLNFKKIEIYNFCSGIRVEI